MFLSWFETNVYQFEYSVSLSVTLTIIFLYLPALFLKLSNKLKLRSYISYETSQGYDWTVWSKSHVRALLSFFIIFVPTLMASAGSRYCDSIHPWTDWQIQTQQQLIDWQFSCLSAAVTISCQVWDCNLLISFFIRSDFIWLTGSEGRRWKHRR